jgi:hypothetical protein
MIKNLLTQNSDLRRTGIFAWTIPAHIVHLTSGERVNTCPQAGICAALCYAKSGTYNFSNVKAAHIEKLELVYNTPLLFHTLMAAELAKPRYHGKYIRIHDAGDFFSESYARIWLNLATLFPNINFYAYTKEVKLFKETLAGLIPDNLTITYSLGGRQDWMIDKAVDRHCEIFASMEALEAAGYTCIEADDKLSATSPNHRIGLVSNNIKHLKKKQGERSFGEIQATKKIIK